MIAGLYLAPRGTITSCAAAGKVGTSHQNKTVAANAPKAWAATNAGTSAGRMPANVLGNARAMVSAGFAKDVEAVNQ